MKFFTIREAPGSEPIIKRSQGVSQSYRRPRKFHNRPGHFGTGCFTNERFWPGRFVPWLFGPGHFAPDILDQDISPLDILNLDVSPPDIWTRTFRPLTFWPRTFRPPDIWTWTFRPLTFSTSTSRPLSFWTWTFWPLTFWTNTCRSSARTINIKTCKKKKSWLTSCQHHELHCLADVIFYRSLTVFQCYLLAIMHELNNSLCTYVYFKDVSAPLESIFYLGPHAWDIKENEIKQARKK